MYQSPSHSNVFVASRQDKRPKRNKKRAVKAGSGSHPANDFLNTTFYPLVADSIHFKKRVQRQRDFYSSLCHLARLYRFKPLDVSSYVYPYDVLMACRNAADQLKRVSPDLHLLIIEDDTHAATLATAKVYDTGRTLYYIPLQAVHEMLASKRNRKTAALLLSVLAYLYQVVGIEYYMDSYIGGCYESLLEWIETSDGDFEPSDYHRRISDIMTSFYFGRKMKKQLAHPYTLQAFESRLLAFKPTSQTEEQLLTVAVEAFDLYRAYPARGIYDSFVSGLIDPHEEYRVMPDQYLSFTWAAAGWLLEDSIEYVNGDLQEMGAIDEPLALQFFDKPQKKPLHDLSFETKLFHLLEELIDYLNTVR